MAVETDNLKMSGYIFVCSDEAARHEGVELPMEEDGTLLLSVLQSQFEGASGLKYRSEFVCGICTAVTVVNVDWSKCCDEAHKL